VQAPDIFIPFEKYHLNNGLEVILHRDVSLPLVAVNIWYHVGPVNEPPKRSGFAHLFEHLMFAGSLHIGSHFIQRLESIGATNVNGTTNWDRTNYFETVPREFLELALWIESDRMGFLIDGLSQKALDIQRDVVKNERRQSFENAPYGPSSLAMMDTLFPKGHPYHGAIIGSIQDLSSATFDDVKAFYRDFYAPSNATVALAGDFDTSQAKSWIEKYFGMLRSLPKPTTVPIRPSTPIAAARLVIDEPVQVARVAFGWVTPPAYQPGSAALDVATDVLAGGKATRLYRALVVEQKLAVDVSASADDNALGSLFMVDAYASNGVSSEKLEHALLAEISRLVQVLPTEAELNRAKKRILLSTTRDLQSLNGPGGESGRAGQLQRFNQYWGNPAAIRDWYHREESFQPAALVGMRALYGTYRGAPVNGSVSDVKRLQLSALKSWYGLYVVPSSVAFIAVGPIEAENIIKTARRSFADWHAASPPSQAVEYATKTQSSNDVIVVDRKGAAQSALFAAQPFPRRLDSGYEARLLLNDIFGGLFTSRINMNLREAHAYTYGARSSVVANRNFGAFIIQTDVRTDATAASLKELIGELSAVASPNAIRPIGEDELGRARADLIHRLGARLEQNRNLVTDMETLFVQGLSPNYYANLPGIYSQMDNTKVGTQAALIHPDNFTIVIVGDQGKIEPTLIQAGFKTRAPEADWLD
jgi:predicted Zn-dependent peptidase